MLIKNLDYVMFSLSTWCVSNCIWCKNFNNVNNLYSQDNILKNINRAYDIWFYWKNIMFFNYNFFDLNNDYIKRILLNIKNNNLVFHTSLVNLKKDKIEFAIKENIKIVYQINLSKNSFYILLKNINLLLRLNLEVIFWVKEKDRILYRSILNSLLKLWFNLYKDNYIYGNIKIKFFFYEWQRIKINKCFLNNAFNFWKNEIIINNKIFESSYFEILINWDVRVHEPPCWYWDLVITNIYRSKGKIVKDFQKFSCYIKNFLYNFPKGVNCELCNKIKYIYER